MNDDMKKLRSLMEDLDSPLVEGESLEAEKMIRDLVASGHTDPKILFRMVKNDYPNMSGSLISDLLNSKPIVSSLDPKLRTLLLNAAKELLWKNPKIRMATIIASLLGMDYIWNKVNDTKNMISKTMSDVEKTASDTGAAISKFATNTYKNFTSPSENPKLTQTQRSRIEELIKELEQRPDKDTNPKVRQLLSDYHKKYG